MIPQKALHQPVLQGVEADDHEPAPDSQTGPGSRQDCLEFVQLPIDMDADGLERAGGRVASGLTPDHSLDDSGELGRRADGLKGPRLRDGPRDLPG